MKKIAINLTLALAAMLVVFSYGFKPATAEPQKITICHMPPGNPDNCQEITISMAAFETHIDHHDDALVCHNQDEHEFYRVISIKYHMKLVTAFE